MKLWMLRNPDGKDVAVFPTKKDAWFDSFLFQTPAHQELYWKRPEESQSALRKKGWTVVAGKFVEDRSVRIDL